MELDDANHVVLVNPGDMGNMGTIIRTMLGFNYSNLTIIKPGVDVFDPRVIRASMGALFNINFEYFDSFSEYLDKYPKRNIYSLMLKGLKIFIQLGLMIKNIHWFLAMKVVGYQMNFLIMGKVFLFHIVIKLIL